MRPFKPDGLRVGEILYDWVESAGKPKYQLCVWIPQKRSKYGLIVLSTGEEEKHKRPLSSLTVEWRRLLLPRPKTGYSEFDLSSVRQLPSTSIGANATVFPSIGRTLAADLQKSVDEIKESFNPGVLAALLDAFRSIQAEDPTPAAHRAFRRRLYGSRSSGSPKSPTAPRTVPTPTDASASMPEAVSV